MLDRDACERRVYRLAMLLVGDAEAATGVIEAVVGAQPDLRRLDNAHMDRLTVLRCREIASAKPVAGAAPAEAAAALAGLPLQQREAWVFSRVYRFSPREMARAMDCSRTALRRHLESAEEAMHRAVGRKADESAEALLRFSMSLDVPPFYRARLRRRRRIKWAVRMAAGLLAIALLTAAFWIIGWAVIGWEASPLPATTGP